MVRQPLPRGLNKAIERLEAEPERAWRLTDLAEICGVAPRTVEKHFRRFLGHAPRAFLKNCVLSARGGTCSAIASKRASRK